MPNKLKKKRPKRAMNAYCIFIKEMKDRHMAKNLTFIEFTKFCSEQWRAMSCEEKQYFYEKAAVEKQRYQTDLQAFQLAQPKKRCIKRPLTAYFHFCKVERPKVVAKHPNWKVTQVVKELAKMWRNAPKHLKEKYKCIAQRNRERYLIKKKQLQAQGNCADSDQCCISYESE